MTLTSDPASPGGNVPASGDEHVSVPPSWERAPSGPSGGHPHNQRTPRRSPSGGITAPGRARITERTLRRDRYWLQPAITAAILFLFIVYGTWRAFENRYYFSEPYLSPFYSPCLTTGCARGSSDLGHWVSVNLWRWSPALIVLIFPLGFRLTCYYYRKAYYRSFWQSPPACAVAEPHARYSGETRLPLILQNVHRWFFYVALLFAGLLTWDAVHSFRNTSGHWGHMGLGTLLMLINAALIWGYTVSCHSCRHITGGRLNNFGRHPYRYRAWTLVSRMNAYHMRFAWASLVSLVVVDFYIRLVAAGTFSDPRFF